MSSFQYYIGMFVLQPEVEQEFCVESCFGMLVAPICESFSSDLHVTHNDSPSITAHP
jgi:hypothetical protein